MKGICGLVLVSLVLVACAPIRPAELAQSQEPLTIGAVLPLTGPAAVWGESIRSGMEFAREELAAEGVSVAIVYEDSQATAAGGVSAFRKLQDVNHADAIVAAFSRATIPLIPLADEEQTPLIATLVSAMDVTKGSEYSFRLFADAEGYVHPLFDTVVPDQEIKRIAVVHLNDEYGVSVREVIRKKAAEKGVTIVSEEAVPVGAADARGALTKAKEADPDALVLVVSTPIEIANVFKQVRELDLSTPILESSVTLAEPSLRGHSLEGITQPVYSNAFGVTLGTTGQEFKAAFEEKTGKPLFFAAALGYDTVKLLAQASAGKKVSGPELAEAIRNLKTFDSTNGVLTIEANGEINPVLTPVLVTKTGLEAQ